MPVPYLIAIALSNLLLLTLLVIHAIQLRRCRATLATTKRALTQ